MSMTRINKTARPELIAASDGRLTISVPIQIKRRSGRKLVTLPSGPTEATRPWDGEPTPLQLALARGHRWLAMLESGEVKSLRELARKEGNVTADPLPLIRPKRRWDQRPARTASNQVAGPRSV